MARKRVYTVTKGPKQIHVNDIDIIFNNDKLKLIIHCDETNIEREFTFLQAAQMRNALSRWINEKRSRDVRGNQSVESLVNKDA